MSRFSLILPAVDYGTDTSIQLPIIENSLSDFPYCYETPAEPITFKRWGSQNESPFHCFVDDWRLESIWRHKYKMVDRVILSRFAVLPDFTVEVDSPLVHAFHQVWRSRVIGRYWQDHGVFAIPALQWSRQSINPFLFAGLEQAEVVAVRSPSFGSDQTWIQCAEQFLAIHQPKLVLHFGTKRGFDVWPNAINLNLR